MKKKKSTEQELKACIDRMLETGELVIVDYDKDVPVYALREVADEKGWKPIVN